MKFFILTLLVGISFNAFAQENDLEVKMGSIIQEANQLYSYEKAVWNSTDLLMKNKKLKSLYAGYVVHHSSDTINVSMLGVGHKEVIARYRFLQSNMSSPIESDLKSSAISKNEKELLDIKQKITEQLAEAKYEVMIPQDYNPNLVLMKGVEGYKLYILMGTNESGIIPFGNDYLFKADVKGSIIEWKKFHSSMIPVQSERQGFGEIASAIHSHLRTTPYITATDICTFRLYAQYIGINEFSVYSPALGKTMNYSLQENSITITD